MRPSAWRLSADFIWRPADTQHHINRSHGTCDPVGTFSSASFCYLRRGGPEQVCNPVWYFLEFKMFTRPRQGWENALTSRSSNLSFRSICDIWKCSKQWLFRCHFGAIWIIYQECSKRWFQWRYVNRLTLHFSRRAEIVTNGLLKMCPRLEPQHDLAPCLLHSRIWLEFRHRFILYQITSESLS